MPAAAAAQTAVGASSIAVYPSIIQTVITPGQTSSFTLTANNSSASPVPIYVSAETFSDHGYQDSPAVQWIHISQTDLILEPNQPASDTITVSPPANAEAGGHYLTIYFTPLVPISALQNRGSYAIPRLGVLTFLIVNGAIHEQAQLGNLQGPHQAQSGPLNFNFTFHNKGNVHLLPRGELTIFRAGKPVDHVPIDQRVVLPHQNTSFNLSWNKPAWLAHYTVRATLVYGAKNIHLNSNTVSVWVIPWLTIGLLTIGSLGLVGFVLKTHRRWRAALKIIFTRNT